MNVMVQLLRVGEPVLTQYRLWRTGKPVLSMLRMLTPVIF